MFSGVKFSCASVVRSRSFLPSLHPFNPHHRSFPPPLHPTHRSFHLTSHPLPLSFLPNSPSHSIPNLFPKTLYVTPISRNSSIKQNRTLIRYGVTDSIVRSQACSTGQTRVQLPVSETFIFAGG
jgi:hypothetical protein